MDEAASSGGRRGPATLGALALAALVVALAATHIGVADARSVPQGAPAPWSVTATPTSGLVDGQRVTINIKAAPGTVIYEAAATLCRSGVAYQSSTDDIRPQDSQPGGPNCPPIPLSTNADTITVTTSTYENAGTPEGETFSYRVGAGQVNWNRNPDRAPVSLTCGTNDPCTLVVKAYVQVGDGTAHWEPWTQSLSYRIDDPIAGCGGPADGLLGTGGSDRMSAAWVAWTLAGCARPGRVGASSGGTFLGEGKAMSLFADRQLDLAYSAVGYHAAAKLTPADEHPDGLRPAVRVPIALNATVLAVSNGARGGNGKNIPYKDIKLTLDEVAALLSGGTYDMSSRLPAIFARNPELAATGFFNTSSSFQVAASAEAESTSWLATRHVDQLRPDKWRVPDLPVFGSDAGQPRGADAALALASPSYAQSLNMFSGRTVLEKNLNINGFGGIWVLTDLATAQSLGLTPVSIENAAGAFVAPTPETLAAAVPTLVPTADGTLLPDPAAVGSTQTSAIGTAAPYPLTFVEYAYAPAEPLVDIACNLRPASQALLTDWLGYIAGPGQAVLPAGFVALPPKLAAEAATAIPRVGASPLPCTPPPAAPATAPSQPDTTATPTDITTGEISGGSFTDLPATTTDLSDAGSTELGSSDASGDSVGDGSATSGIGTDTGPVSEASSGGPTSEKPAAEEIVAAPAAAVPPFAGSRSGNLLPAVLAMLAIVGLTSGVAVASARSASGRSRPEGARGR